MLSDSQRDFVTANPSAAMITVGDDGFAKAVRVGVTLVGGELWSSGTRDRVRTRRLLRDPRCTLFVFGSGHQALTLETRVAVLDGPEAPAESVRLFRSMQKRPDGPLMWFGQELDEAEFERAMAAQGRVIYQFEVLQAYGLA